MAVPMALFYVNEKDELIPIAIQLFQEPKENNPVSQWWKLWAAFCQLFRPCLHFDQVFLYYLPVTPVTI